jgi:hypothetical protein
MKTPILKSMAAVAALISLPAAANWHTVPGAVCESRSGSAGLDYYFSGRAINLTTSDIDAVCPVQRNVVAPYYTEDALVRVTVLDAHYTANVCCTAYVRSNDGDTLAGSPQACTSGSDTVNHKILTLNVPSVAASFNGFITVNCNIPGAYAGSHSALASIEISE